MPPKAAEAFYKSESRYRTLVENSCDIIYSLDLEGCFTFVSPAWKTVLGHEQTDVLGHNIREFIHPEDAPRYEVAIATAIRDNAAQEAIYRIRHIDGKWRWHTSRVAPHRDDDGVQTVIGIAHDITERLRIEEMMAQTEKMIMVSGLAAGMAHEINNPLGAIMQHAQNIERRVSGTIDANLKAAAEVGVSLDLVRAYLEQRGIFGFHRPHPFGRDAGLRNHFTDASLQQPQRDRCRECGCDGRTGEGSGTGGYRLRHEEKICVPQH